MAHIPTKTYYCWSHMKSRCLNKKHAKYHLYGGRGITVCKKWLAFKNFLTDMGEKPEGKSLDRIDNSKGYDKKNCRWASHEEQNRNKRTNIMYKGECAKTASLRLGGNRGLVTKRLSRGWPIEKAFSVKIDY